MKVKHESLVQIKATKNVYMGGNRELVTLDIGDSSIAIPMRLVFQVHRGLLSYIQKYYRRKQK